VQKTGGPAVGCVVGIDLLPAHPPAGMTPIQGNFLATRTQTQLKRWLAVMAENRRKRLDGARAAGAREMVALLAGGSPGEVAGGGVTSGSGSEGVGKEDLKGRMVDVSAFPFYILTWLPGVFLTAACYHLC
jgi:hypothetical protein